MTFAGSKNILHFGLKFSQRLSIRQKFKLREIIRGIWNPQMRLWRDAHHILLDYNNQVRYANLAY
ncbi:hypothetical protein ACFL6I_25580, partial [candidate division KSB1 bacterium]